MINEKKIIDNEKNISDLLIHSNGLGIQSITISLLAHKGIIQKPDYIIFADTKFEPPHVYNQLVWLQQQLKQEIITVSAGNIEDDSIKGGRFASLPFFVKNQDGAAAMLKRQCTSDYKIRPIISKIRDLRRWYIGRPKVKMYMGISLDEIQRVRDNKVRWIENVYPLIDLRMTRTDCENWLKNNGYPVPQKSSCIGCPFHNNQTWKNMKELDKESWDRAVAFDKKNRKLSRIKGDVFVHRSLKPLDEVQFESKNMEFEFEEDCTGHCGV